MTFSALVSLVEIGQEYRYRNRFGKPTAHSFRIVSKDHDRIEFITASSMPHSLRPADWDEVVANLGSLRSGLTRRKDLKTWRPSYAYAFIGHFESKGCVFQTSH